MLPSLPIIVFESLLLILPMLSFPYDTYPRPYIYSFALSTLSWYDRACSIELNSKRQVRIVAYLSMESFISSILSRVL